MRAPPSRPLPFSLAGISSLIGRSCDIDTWAKQHPIPNTKVPGTFLSGEEIHRILGVEAKSWDPDLFRDFQRIVEVAAAAMRHAQIAAREVEAVVVATSTPYETHLDSDAFRLMRALGVRDHVLPLQLGAGCGGMARIMSMASSLDVRTLLIVTYEVSSLYMSSPLYVRNDAHPLADALWMSPALFSDGAAAVVLKREEGARGFSFYSRDALAFGDAPGFDEPLVLYPGGGAAHAPGTPNAEALACFGMQGAATKRYYARGMTLNHERLSELRPGYLQDVKRIYTHQASPRLVRGFIDEICAVTGASKEKFSTNSERFGNLVIPSTLKMIDDDLQAKTLEAGDEICVSVVGAGPERGAFILPLSCV